MDIHDRVWQIAVAVRCCSGPWQGLVGAALSRGRTGQQPGVHEGGMFKRLENWAADSPERSRLLVIILCLTIGFVVLGVVFGMAWLLLGSISVADLVE